jgi:hypothetical protein
MRKWLLLSARVVVNALIGAFAGAVPPVAWYAWIEWTEGFRNGMGGIAWLVAVAAATALGGVAGAAVGTAGWGVRAIRIGDTTRVLLGACGGGALGAGVAHLAAGHGNDRAVAVVLLAETVCIILGMVVLTSPRAISPGPERP